MNFTAHIIEGTVRDRKALSKQGNGCISFFSDNYVQQCHVVKSDEAIYQSPMLPKPKQNLLMWCGVDSGPPHDAMQAVLLGLPVFCTAL